MEKITVLGNSSKDATVAYV